MIRDHIKFYNNQVLSSLQRDRGTGKLKSHGYLQMGSGLEPSNAGSQAGAPYIRLLSQGLRQREEESSGPLQAACHQGACV